MQLKCGKKKKNDNYIKKKRLICHWKVIVIITYAISWLKCGKKKKWWLSVISHQTYENFVIENYFTSK